MIRRLRFAEVAGMTMLLPGVLAVACAQSAAPPATGGDGTHSFPLASAAEEEGPAGDDIRAFHRHHHIGFIGFALVSLPTLGLPPAEEAQVEKIRADIK